MHLLWKCWGPIEHADLPCNIQYTEYTDKVTQFRQRLYSLDSTRYSLHLSQSPLFSKTCADKVRSAAANCSRTRRALLQGSPRDRGAYGLSFSRPNELTTFQVSLGSLVHPKPKPQTFQKRGCTKGPCLWP